MTYSYYVEPDYWDSGYTEDITVNFIYSAAQSSATASILSAGTYIKLSGAAAQASASFKVAGNYVRIEGALASATASTKAAGQNLLITTSLVSATTWARGAVELTRIYPGVNLNAKSSALAAIGVTRKTSATAEAFSSTKAGARIFWEQTTPSSGVWTVIVPQSAGSGE